MTHAPRDSPAMRPDVARFLPCDGDLLLLHGVCAGDACCFWKGDVMRIDIDTNVPIPTPGPDMVGNVYPVRGGFGARNGHMHVIISHYDKVQGCCRYSGYCTVTVDCDGEIVGANSYGCHYFDNKVPMARVDGLDQVALVMRSL